MSKLKIPVDPKLPKDFDNTPNEDRPKSHKRWWNRPYIVTCTFLPWPSLTETEIEVGRKKWYASWPSGTRYDVRCLDGGAWDRSTWWGSFATLEEAIRCAEGGSTIRSS